MKTGEFKFNNANGALLCPDCRRIVVYGKPMADFYSCPDCKNYFRNPLTTT